MGKAKVLAALAAAALLAPGCAKGSESTRLQTVAAMHRIEQHVNEANEHALADDFFESLRQAQYGQSLARQIYDERKKVLDLAREQDLKPDPKQRLDMSGYDMPATAREFAQAQEHVAYFKEKIPFTFLRMVDGLAAEDAELRAKARKSFERFCTEEHPGFDELRRDLLTENKLRVEKVAYAHPGEASQMIYDCFRKQGV